MDKHPIDQWQEDADNAEKQFLDQCLKDTALVYQVFGNDAGKLLLERWTEILIHQPTVKVGDDMLSIGMSEGYKNFIRSIINSVNVHEVK